MSRVFQRDTCLKGPSLAVLLSAVRCKSELVLLWSGSPLRLRVYYVISVLFCRFAMVEVDLKTFQRVNL